ncbi:hypothetical protein NPS53_08615 [Pseudomonas putida]|uniref:hypothetical protein n=1 Tax=Pseudomonas putida TaxID=303 RepID=UPI0023638E06|nr:hypothetical protein [Pseudomonas putida]MDD2139635.1 hypothetical protein [Pseudomonas putida]HDS1721558.1 hypothetical protein [Pseudomonas putida]
MSNSTQINSGPTLRQFATYLDAGELVVTSKLGPRTISRVRFKELDYPSSSGKGADFIREKVMSEFPAAATVLGAMFDQCITDQARAVNCLIGA